ncbi:lysozyme [Phenylobacterium deserti]|uniref:Lysozyme n=1 Tax=Phenylobacterium deserti TaxID=1914756 RepID=A0A328AA37_9CAUL|nr:lysozyme [Phenylobacterium deserti]RAK51036.1 lysozyme [Phenylobacterium deserti]
MKPRHQVSRAAIDLIKRFEGYRRKAAQLPDGRWTIGYGHTLTAREGAVVSDEDAEALLLYDLITVAHVVNETTFATLTQNQFDALCAFAFNIGLDNFRRSSVLKRVNEGALIQAAFAMELWRKAEFEGERIVVDALIRRRAAEKLLFLTPPGGDWTPAPSPLLKPLLDLDSFDLAPRQPATTLAAPLEGEKAVAERVGEPVSAPRPVEPEETSPIRAAAEEITARLQTIFPEPGFAEIGLGEPDATEDGEGDASVQPLELLPEEPRPQVDFAPPIKLEPDVSVEGPSPQASTSDGETEPAESAPATDEAPEELAAEPVIEPELAPEDAPAPVVVAEEPPSELFAPPPPANDQLEGDEALAPEPEAAAEAPRVVIDDTERYEFAPRRDTAPEPAPTGFAALFLLAVIGLAFFGGGIFWALNARPGPATGLLTPLTVGWLAGVAGVAFFVVAVFLLLQRLGQAAERRRRKDLPRF